MIRRVPAKNSTDVAVTFTIPAGGPRSTAMSVVGDFNGWDPTAHPLTASTADGVRSATVSLPGGQRYRFRYSPRTGNGSTMRLRTATRATRWAARTAPSTSPPTPPARPRPRRDEHSPAGPVMRAPCPPSAVRRWGSHQPEPGGMATATTPTPSRLVPPNPPGTPDTTAWSRNFRDRPLVGSSKDTRAGEFSDRGSPMTLSSPTHSERQHPGSSTPHSR